jgi:hypothetical protein
VHGGQDPTDPKSTPQNSSTSTTTTTNTNTTTNKGADDAYYCKNGLDFSLKLNGHVKISSATGQTIEGDANGMYTKCK